LIYKVSPENYTKYHDTFLISLILSVITIPFLWFLSQGNIQWVLTCAILWMSGVFITYHLFIRYIFPMMLTKIGTFLLSAILAVFTIWLNTTIIFNIITFEDIQTILNQSLFNISFATIVLFTWFYVLIAGTLLSNLELRLNTITNRHKQILQTLSSTPLFSYRLIIYYTEVLLVFILPLAILFWTEVTYSTRLLLGLLSISLGVGLFILRLQHQPPLHRLLITILSLSVVLIINSSAINLLGFDHIPASTLKARIHGEKILQDLEAQSIQSPAFQFNSSLNNAQMAVYKIIASIPQIGLHLGHRVATLPNEEIEIKVQNDHYTIYDQYNQTLLKIKREKD